MEVAAGFRLLGSPHRQPGRRSGLAFRSNAITPRVPSGRKEAARKLARERPETSVAFPLAEGVNPGYSSADCHPPGARAAVRAYGPAYKGEIH